MVGVAVVVSLYVLCGSSLGRLASCLFELSAPLITQVACYVFGLGCATILLMIDVVLYQPKIPPNTGNIARQCVGMHARLHLVGPLDIDLSTKAVRRAGLDYWEHLDLTVHDDPGVFLDWLGDREPWLISKFGKQPYHHAPFRTDDVIVFGNELNGLPDQWLERWPDRVVSIPMTSSIRSYNLANAMAIVLAQASCVSGLYESEQWWV